MNDSKTNDPKDAELPNPRLPYVKPAFCSESVFEIKALQCGSNLTGSTGCLHGGPSG